MKLLVKMLMIALALMLCSCGAEDTINGEVEEGKPLSTDSDTHFVIRGNVVSAFSVTVNQQDFSDMEQYFRYEVEGLDKRVEGEGYAGYNARFEASIGFQDLYVGMTVYVSAAEHRGYQGQTKVNKDGTFAMTIPIEGAGYTYRVRTNKRINLFIFNDEEMRKICYNFSAIGQNVPYDQTDLPVILDQFETSLTLYECNQEDNSSLEIPASEEESETVPETAPSDEELLPSISPYLTNHFTPTMSHYDIHDYSRLVSVYNPGGGTLGYYLWTFQSGYCESDSNMFGEYDCYYLTLYTGKTRGIYYNNLRFEYLDASKKWPAPKLDYDGLLIDHLKNGK